MIIPVVDLTPTAEGSRLPEYLQTSLAFGSQTAFSVSNANTTIISTTGFYRIFGVVGTRATTVNSQVASFLFSDGLATKNVWSVNYPPVGAGEETCIAVQFDFNVFLAAGESISANSSSTATRMNGSIRQLADINGNLTDPVGFVAQ